MTNLQEFVAESNRIEGILRDPRAEEIHAHYRFLELEQPTVYDLVNLVKVLQPDARLRDNISVPGVRVGNHIAPASGPEIREQLEFILRQSRIAFQHKTRFGAIYGNMPTPWRTHVDYEILHPFTDGNGRSGRALWLWCHGGRAPLGFLHQFYYETLANTRP